MLTKQPDTTADSRAACTSASPIPANASDENYFADGAINLPLGESVAVRAVGFYEKDAGFFERKFCESPADVASGTCFPNSSGGAPIGTVDNVAELESYGGAVALKWQATDALSITPRFMYQKAEYNGLPLADIFARRRARGLPGPAGSVHAARTHAAQLRAAPVLRHRRRRLRPLVARDARIRYDTGVGTSCPRLRISIAASRRPRTRTDFIYANFLAVSLITGLPGTALPGQITEIKDYQRFVQEIRFASELDGPLQFVVGGFYSDTHGRIPFASKYPPSVIRDSRPRRVSTSSPTRTAFPSS
jgi:iron complex outermembrane receptor protein